MSRIPSTATRIVVITPTGGAQEFWADHWDVLVQDDGATVKLFAKGGGESAQETRNRRLAHDMDLD